MAEKTTPEDYQTKRTSLGSYSSRVFKESSVGIISSLAHTTSIRRRIFKVLALILCLTGFFYQSGKFLAAVFQYPTSVDIDIKRPDLLTVPAYTFCDNNAINRGIFCTKFPERCEKPDEAFCAKFEDYCDRNRSLVPKKEYYWLNKNLTFEELTELNVNRSDFVSLNRSGAEEDLSGPFFRVTGDLSEPAIICYSLNDRVDSSLEPRLAMKDDRMFKSAVNVLQFNVRSQDTFLPGSLPGILFDIHSPFLAVNPLETGIFMKPGRKYMIFVNMEEEILLQDPYETNCLNYTEVWEKNGFKGPRLQDMCKEDCVADISIQCFNCVVPMIKYPRKERPCYEEDREKEDCPANTKELYESCISKCRDDCKRTKFSYTIQERYMPNFDIQGNQQRHLDSSIRVEVYLEGDEIIVLKHSPKYMFVEVFSNIGGFIGCWLGINLLDITDIFEGFFRIVRYSFKRR